MRRGLKGATVFCLAVLLLHGPVPLGARELQPAATPAPSPTVEAWATLFQMMERLRASAARRDFTLVHNEDPVAGAAVSTLLGELTKAAPPNGAAMKIAWTVFVREISTLHTAADAGEEEACLELTKRLEEEFQQLLNNSDPALLQAAQQYAARYTCPMHADVVGRKKDTCGKCGMPLDQLVVLLPDDARSGLVAQHAVTATITTDGPLTAGKPAQAILHLRRGDTGPVTLADLIETHTRKIHLLVVDRSLTDYHHEHPQPTGTPGDYAFIFTPQKPGSYLAWADLRPLPFGLQEYEKAIIAGSGTTEPIADRKTRLAGDSSGLHFELNLSRSEVKAGEPTSAILRITKPDGSGFAQLEPVMGAFAHLVGFNEDAETVLHMHPTGAPISGESERGGPELEFKIYATKPGFTRLFAQVQVDGRPVYVPFAIEVAP